MANAIELAKSYVPLLDEVYAREVLTSDLDGAPELVQQGANANELIIPMMDMQGLADYSRNSGYVQGDVTLKNETVKCNFDRGRMFWVDSMDDLETAGIAFGRLAAEFIRTKVGPEIDAFRFATYCSKTGIGKKEETLADGAAVVAALRAATTAMDEDEVSEGDRYLYITPTLYGMISDLDTTKSREILTGFAKIVKVPQKRFHTAIDQLRRHRRGSWRLQEGGRCVRPELRHRAQARCHPVPQARRAQDRDPGCQPGRRRLQVRLPPGQHRGPLRQQAGRRVRQLQTRGRRLIRMKRVGFIPDPTPLATVPAGASQEGRPQAGTVDADISTIAEPDAEPAATAESEPAAEPDKKPAGRKPRRKADEG